MNVTVKFTRVDYTYDDMVIFVIRGKKIILSKDEFTSLGNKTILIDYNLAKKHKLHWRLQYHIPPYIKPTYNQKCIDELRC